MADLISFEMLYWHWIVVGLVLITAELFIPIFVMMWLGIAAVLVGLISLLIPLAFSTQLILWAVFSGVFLLLWHKFVSPRLTDRTLAGLSREAIVGQIGMVTFFNEREGRGRLKFPAPVVGNDEWDFIYEAVGDRPSLENGDKVMVTDISGNSLLVKPQ